VSRRPAPRRESRRLALQVLYAADLGARGNAPPDDAFDAVAANFDLHPGALAFAKQLVCGTLADRNLLRLAVHELFRTDTPAQVVINEAVELARDFGAERSPSFVNGVLDAVARGRDAGEEL